MDNGPWDPANRPASSKSFLGAYPGSETVLVDQGDFEEFVWGEV